MACPNKKNPMSTLHRPNPVVGLSLKGQTMNQCERDRSIELQYPNQINTIPEIIRTQSTLGISKAPQFVAIFGSCLTLCGKYVIFTSIMEKIQKDFRIGDTDSLEAIQIQIDRQRSLIRSCLIDVNHIKSPSFYIHGLALQDVHCKLLAPGCTKQICTTRCNINHSQPYSD